MERKLTFSRKLALGFAVVSLLTGAVAGVAVLALRQVVASKDEVIDFTADNRLDAERLHAAANKKASDARAFFMTKDPKFLELVRGTRLQFRGIITELRREAKRESAKKLLDDIERDEELNQRQLEPLFAERTAGVPMDQISPRFIRDVLPTRERLERTIDELVNFQDGVLKEERAASTAVATSAIRVVLALLAVGVALAVALSWALARALNRTVSTAVRHVQSSSTELQSSAGQQATGAKQQATAMAEVSTTMGELLATSRQIAQSAQRVASIAGDTAAAARSGDLTVQRSQELVGSIRRQVDLIVSHMLELGRKSQQIGGVLGVIDELAEQTNILAINATIEAAGAGEAGRRFAVVAEEIRKLADRVAGSTKDVRPLVEDVRSAVNTTVMATESGSKAVDAGARQFAEVAAAFGQIASLVGTTTEAAREIELSTKQQATAVEQVNVAIANVAQATHEAEASSGQTLQTASELAAMSRELGRIVQADRSA
jgi:methyl-accepting chemotaxis protein